jgi:hypothetical protein
MRRLKIGPARERLRTQPVEDRLAPLSGVLAIVAAAGEDTPALA